MVHTHQPIYDAIVAEIGDEPSLQLPVMEAFYTRRTVSEDGGFTAAHFYRPPTGFSGLARRIDLGLGSR